MRKFVGGLVVLPLGLLLLSCGEGGNASAPSADPPATTPTTAGPPSVTPTVIPTVTPSETPSGTPSGTPSVTRTPAPTPRPSKPKPTKVVPRCEGTMKGGTITVQGNAGLSIINGAFSCAGGKLVDVQRRSSSLRFFHGAKSATIRPGKSQVFAGYRIRVTAATSKQARFVVTFP